MARRRISDDDELLGVFEDMIQSYLAAGELVINEKADRRGHIVYNVPSAAEDEDEEEEDEDVEDFLDLPQYTEAGFARHAKLRLQQEHPLTAKLQGRKVKQPIYNSDDDDDYLDLPQYDPAAFGQW